MKILITVIILIFLFSGCAHSHDIDNCIDKNNLAGFFDGLIEGTIAPIAFVISLFDNKTAVWDVNNNGMLYTLGFLIGVRSWLNPFSSANSDD